MNRFMRAVSLLLVLCFAATLFGVVSFAQPEDPGKQDFDPYIYAWNNPYAEPETVKEGLPEYYIPYAVRLQHISPHYVSIGNTFQNALTACVFNLVNYEMLVQDENLAPEGPYASFGTYCSDVETEVVAGATYRRRNLNEGYFCYDSEGNYLGSERADRLRAVVNNSFPKITDIALLESLANEYLTQTYGEDAVLLQELTGAEVVSATQCAIWNITNGTDYSNPYAYTINFDILGTTKPLYFSEIMYTDNGCTAEEDPRAQTATNMDGFYQYLLSLPGEKAEEIAVHEDSLSVLSMLAAADLDGTALTVLVNVDATIDGDDDMTLTASVGNQSAEISLTEENKLSNDNVYAITVSGLDDASLTADSSVSLSLNGIQSLDSVFYFEAKPVDGKSARDSAQAMVGYDSGPAPVACSGTFKIGNLVQQATISKQDADTKHPLSGVAFDLYKKSQDGDILCGTYHTDKNGEIRISLPENAGDFYFIESTPLPGYQPNPTPVTGGTVENTWVGGTLEVSKKLLNSSEAQADESFRFQITLDLSTAPVANSGMDWMTDEYFAGLPESSKDITWAVIGEGVISAEFTLCADEAVKFTGLPLGASCTIEELLEAENYFHYNVTTQITQGTGSDPISGKGTEAELTIARQNAVIFTNAVTDEPLPETGEPAIPAVAAVLILLCIPCLMLKRNTL